MADWKWTDSSNRAFQLVGQFFGVSPQNLTTIKDGDVTKLLKQADASEIQVKRTQDAVKAVKKSWRSQLRINASIHGLVRTGLGLITQQRRLEAQTTKESAKTITDKLLRSLIV